MLSLTTRMRIYLIYFFFSALCIDENKVPSDQLHTPPSTLATLFSLPSLFFVYVCVPPVFTVVPMGGVGKKEARHDDVIGRYI